jgi:hypothetical protein
MVGSAMGAPDTPQATVVVVVVDVVVVDVVVVDVVEVDVVVVLVVGVVFGQVACRVIVTFSWVDNDFIVMLLDEILHATDAVFDLTSAETVSAKTKRLIPTPSTTTSNLTHVLLAMAFPVPCQPDVGLRPQRNNESEIRSVARQWRNVAFGSIVKSDEVGRTGTFL